MIEVALYLTALMLLCWLISIALGKVSFVDGVWGAGFVLCVWVAAYSGNIFATGERELILLALVSIWGLRLSGYLFRRFLSDGEDRRYTKLVNNRQGAAKHLYTFWAVFATQGIFIFILSLPLVLDMLDGPNPISLNVWIGLALWALGIFFEWLGDWQLSRFKSDPANEKKVMDKGLWAWTRHPNYFGEACIWWGMWIITFDLATLFAPVLVTFLVLKLSGIPLAESGIEERRPGYAEYRRKTSSFFPLPPS